MSIDSHPWLEKYYQGIKLVNLPHAVIINGPKGVGKKILSREIARLIISNEEDISSNNDHHSLMNTNTHPDFYEINKDVIKVGDISRRENDKWDPEKGKKDALSFLNLTPSISSNKVLLMHNVDNMTFSAQDALLKSLEEPASYAYIIMTTSRPYSLKTTIYSRCQTLNIKNPSNNEIDSWLETRGLGDHSSLDFPSYYSPLMILSSIEDSNERVFKNFIESFDLFLTNKITQTEFIKSLNDLDLDLIEKLNFIIEILKILLSSQILKKPLNGIYRSFGNFEFSNLKISNIINDINDLKFNFYKVKSINESHIFNYLCSDIKSSFK